MFAWSQEDVQSAGDSFWPQYRGPFGNGHAALTANPPVRWGEDENVRWKKEIAGKAWSSPVVWGDKLWITNASEDGLEMTALCLAVSSGETLWEKVIFKNVEVQADFHEFNSYASPTPIVDRDYVFVSFGAYGTACLNRVTGEKIWERRDLPCNHYRGAGSSPIFYEEGIIFHMDGYDVQYLVALSRRTGETLWKSDRSIDYGTEDGDLKKAYGTPHVIEVIRDGRTELQLLSPAAKAIFAYAPETGEELWRVRYDEHSASLRPLFDGEFVYTTTGFSRGKMLAIVPDNRGDITDSGVVWSASRAIGAKPSPLLIENRLFTLEDRGVLSAIDKADGKTLWQKRLGGDFSSSPIFADGKIYCFDEQGKSHVVTVDGEVLAVNQLASGCLSSPALSGDTLIVRTREAIYAISE